LEAEHATSCEVGHHEALHPLSGVDEAERDLIAAANHAVPHALLFHDLLKFAGVCIA
jgi:hypothetical protein